jgi:hypothetical protein
MVCCHALPGSCSRLEARPDDFRKFIGGTCLLTAIHCLSKIYSNLNDIEKGLETQLFIAKVSILNRNSCCENSGINYHQVKTEKLLEKLYTREARLRTGIFRRVLEESCLLAVKSTLYIASGFVWEDWLDDRLEDQKIKDRSIEPQGVRNIPIGVSDNGRSFDWLVLPTLSFSKVWDLWGKKEKLD